MKRLFPEIAVEGEGSIDFEKLRLILGDEVDEGQERYAFTWPGKANAIRQAQTPSTATLRPDEDASVDWDTTENLYIEGDNLEVLKLLQRGYHGKVKMIYIDPPYNTGHDFVYKDSFQDSIENYKEQAGLRGQSNADTSGRYHSDWLSMMYPRLKLARELLSDDGVVFISIDGNEERNLRAICDEVFGETNFRNQILVRRRTKSLNLQFANNGLHSFNVGTEAILVYSKSDSFAFTPLRVAKKDAPTKGTWNVFWSNADRPTMRYELLGFTPTEGQWRWRKELALEAVSNYKEFEEKYSDNLTLEEYWEQTGKSKAFIRRIPDGYGKNGGVQYWVAPSSDMLRTSNWTDLEVSQIAKEFDLPFSNPKNITLIEEVVSSVPGKDFIVLDFFAGSSTTADAVMRLNSYDNGTRRSISVQFPEKFSENSDESLAGYNSICDVGIKRLILAGNLLSTSIAKENMQLKLGEEPKPVPDIGFRVLKLDSSNFDKVEGGMLIENLIKTGRSNDDIIFEMMLKWGLELSLPMEKTEVAGYPITSIAADELICCMDEGLTVEVLEAIAALEPKRVFFLDSVLTDTIKLNAAQIFKRIGDKLGYEIELRTA